EEGVAADSQVETFAAVKLLIDNARWSGVPFYLRTGKRLAAKASQIVVAFRREPLGAFSDPTCDVRGPNRLIIRIYPDEGISLVVDAKVPGVRPLLRPVKMDFRYGSSFESASPEAYEHLLLDAMNGEAMSFIRRDEVEAAWAFIDPIKTSWDEAGLPKLVMYPSGSWGPEEADRLFGDPYKHWYVP
ncbi:MAG TPA: glucose-6-phosphate dehydrogenase, partial [Phycisphaerae bacterium]|nr:glucose-6-phosphate dehydrogenase [Phycisphaerae bacterium]